MANIPISAFTVPANTVGIGLSGFSLTGSNAQSIVDLAGTWNTTGTPTALKLNVTDTASNASSLLMDLRVGGNSRLSLAKTGTLAVQMITGDWSTGEPTIKFVPDSGIPMGLEVAQGGSALMIKASNNRSGMVFRESSVDMRSDGRIRWTNATNPLTTSDLVLTRDAAGTLAQVNGTNAQTFRIYNTTDSGITNYERVSFGGWVSDEFVMRTESAGTGAARHIRINASSGKAVRLGNADGTATVSIGAISLTLLNAVSFLSSADGVLRIANNAANDFGRLQFGGTSSSFPALKRNSTALETKLADDSAYAPHAMQYLDVTDGITAPASATGRARIYVDTADGDLKVIFADGTVKTIVTDS